LLVPSLLRSTETVDVDDVEALAAEAVVLYVQLRGREDLARLIAAGRCAYEVPFSYEPPDRPGELVRGVIDCLVWTADGRATVIEFKTGGRRPEHDAQAGTYARAISTALDGAEVDVRLVYADRPVVVAQDE
jgi:ATP-dependent exoDNAse (exonuclease V) beta subunit